MKFQSAAFLLSVFFCASALGADRTNPNLTVPGERTDERAAPAPAAKMDRKWFAGFDAGFGTAKYSGALKTEIDGYRYGNSADRSPMVNLEGYFAWRLGTSRTILGPTLAIAFESYNTTTTSDLEVGNYFFGGMVEHYFDDEIRRGFYGRFDIGFNEIALSRSGNTTSDRSYDGTGIRLGFGYAIPAGPRKRVRSCSRVG